MQKSLKLIIGLVTQIVIIAVFNAKDVFGQQSIWSQILTFGSTKPSAVYHLATNRAILFGGLFGDNVSYSNDIWILTNANGQNLPTWIRLSPTGNPPLGRQNHSAVYDTMNNRMIVFGGGAGLNGDFTTLFNDVWILTNADGLGGTPQWIQLFPTGGPPPAREGHGAVYDNINNRMIVFGGGNNGIMNVPNDVWVLNNANGLGGTPNWIQLTPAGTSPPPLENFAVCYDPTSNRMTIVGGCCGWTNNIWVLTNANGLGSSPSWIQIFPSGILPMNRQIQAFGYNTYNNRLIIYGGGNGEGLINDLWALNNANCVGDTARWINLIPNNAAGSPPATFPFSPSIYDQATDKMTLFLGGQGGELWIVQNASGPLTDVKNISDKFPRSSLLFQNYPNPFNPSTKFEYSLNHRSKVKVEVFNEQGQLITTLVDATAEAGIYQSSWNGKSSSGVIVSSGIYFYRLSTDGEFQTKKMMMVK